ncbi:MAG: type II toxin-antitoxin system Phd/YefM family antitoxin [Devosia sp.]
MSTVELNDTDTRLLGLIERAASGESVVIARDGKPVAKLVAIEAPKAVDPARRLGFLEGDFKIPDDFDTMMAEEIEEMFYGKP